MKRKTGKDYRKELNDLNKSIESLVAHIESRLLELIKLYPDAVVVDKGHGQQMFCKQITKTWFQNTPLDVKISYIINIEKWSADQENIIQKTLEI